VGQCCRFGSEFRSMFVSVEPCGPNRKSKMTADTTVLDLLTFSWHCFYYTVSHCCYRTLLV
jgi:hypothetical protein